MTTERVTVRMSRGDGGTPWGFRIQGGSDFGSPLIIGEVVSGSLSDRAGLKPNDHMVQVTGKDADHLSHQGAQDAIMAAGNNVDLVVHRTVSGVWKPSITMPNEEDAAPVRYSLEKSSSHQTSTHVGSGHNRSAQQFHSERSPQPPAAFLETNLKTTTTSSSTNQQSSGHHRSPSPAQVRPRSPIFVPQPPAPAPQHSPVHHGGGGQQQQQHQHQHQHQHQQHQQHQQQQHEHQQQQNAVAQNASQNESKYVHLQYNSPAPLYSKHNAADAYLQQTGGLFGTDPKLQDKQGFMQSETLKLIQENETGGGGRQQQRQHQERSYEGTLHKTEQQSHSFNQLSHALGEEGGPIHSEPHTFGEPVQGGKICDACGRRITSVFLTAGGKTLHAECFRCTICGSNLKNIGFNTIEDKLYCEVHAKQVQNRGTTWSKPSRDPNAFNYQPEILQKSNVHVSTKVVTPLAGDRGVPTHQFGGGSTHHQQHQHQQQHQQQQHQQQQHQQQYSANTTSQHRQQHSTSQNQITNNAPAPFGGSGGGLSPGGGGGNYSYSSSQTSTYKSGGAHPGSFSPPAPQYSPAPAGGIGNSSQAVNQISSSLSTMKVSSSGGSGSFGAPPPPNLGPKLGGQRAPRKGKGILKALGDMPRVPNCEHCHREIRGPFVLAMQQTWCPDHFVCGNTNCGRKLLDVGFVEEAGQIYCEYCFEKYFAPNCGKCSRPIVGDCVNAMQNTWHPDCFVCTHCRQPFGNSSFFVEDGKPYCENDWNQLYTTKCIGCEFPIEAGDRWVEALGHAYHSNCFACSFCQKELEGQSFFAKGGKPYCKAHA